MIKGKRLIVMAMILSLFVGGMHAHAAFNMTYLYAGSTSSYTTYINRTHNNLNTVSPNYVDVNEEGQFVIKNVDTDFINTVHQKGMKIVPFISNHWDRTSGLKLLENRAERAIELADMVTTYNLDGIHIDIEGLNETSRDDFSDFIKKIREAMPTGKEVSVAVAANPYHSNKGWQGMYDYAELAKHVDYLMIMAYDESWLGSMPGPVASKDFTEGSITYPLSLGIAPEKIVLGIPFYGRIWQVDGNWEGMDSSIKGRGISLDKVDGFLNFYNAEITYDRNKNSMRARFTVTPQDTKLNLYSWGIPLVEGNYEIWYESNETIKERIKVANKYGIKGTGSWSLGQEDISIWSYYGSWLSGQYFKDIQGHWAEDDVQNVYQKDWMLGNSSTTFGPDEALTRAEAAFSLVRALGLDLVNSSYFADVSEEHWAKKSIETAYANGLIHGKGNHVYAPDEKITREQMSQLLYNYLRDQFAPPANGENFSDIKDTDWSYEAVLTMNHNDILRGFGDNTFRPLEDITRGQMASLFVRISSYIEE